MYFYIIQIIDIYIYNYYIEARYVWKPLHLQPLFRNALYYPHSENENVAEELFEKGICLPSGSGMKEEQQKRVINSILNFAKLKTQIEH